MAEMFCMGSRPEQPKDAQKGRLLRPSIVKRRSSLVEGSAEARSRDTLHDSRFTDLQSKVGTPLADFFSILLGVEDLDKNACAGCCRRFSHNVFDVFFDRLLCNEEGICYLFIRPAFGQMFYNGLFPIGKLEFFSGMVCIEILSSSKLFHSDNQASMFNSTTIGKTEAAKEDWLVGISAYSLELKLLPVFCFSPNMERLDNFSTEFCESGWENAMCRPRSISRLFCRIDLFGQLSCLTIHVEQLHCGR